MTVSKCIIRTGLLFGFMLSAQSAFAQEPEKLVIVTGGGGFLKHLEDHFYNAFTESTGIEIVKVTANTTETTAKLRAMNDSGRIEWDIISPDGEFLVTGREYLEPIDCDSLPNVKKYAASGTCLEYGLMRTASTGDAIAYSEDVFPNDAGPTNWAEFWDLENFPGPRSLSNIGTPWYALAAALQADGVEPSELAKPLDLDRAFRKLDEIKPHVSVWWSSGDQSQQALRSGEAVAGMMWDGRAMSMQQEGQPIALVRGQVMQPTYWSIVKGGPNTEAAKKFLDFFISRPESHAIFGQAVHYDTANKEAINYYPEELRSTLLLQPGVIDGLVYLDNEWLSANKNQIITRWNTWISQ